VGLQSRRTLVRKALFAVLAALDLAAAAESLTLGDFTENLPLAARTKSK